MSQEVHSFRIESDWSGGSDGDGVTTDEGGNVAFGRPKELGGAPGRTNPEELLLSAVASCYNITFAILAERRRLPLVRTHVVAEGTVERQLGGTLKFVAIHLRPTIVLRGADDAQRKGAEEMAHKAEQYCVISNAVRGNVAMTVTPAVTEE